MIYITGDTHGDFSRYFDFCDSNKPTKNNVIIVLSDAGLNYSGNDRDDDRKSFANGFLFVTFCIHGNRAMRPFDIPSHKTKMFCGCNVWYEEKYPNILFAKDGEYINSVSFPALLLAMLTVLIKIIAFLVGGIGLKMSNPLMK